MKISELDEKLGEYNEDELLYREYYHSKKDSETFRLFLESLDHETIKDSFLVIPELRSSSNFMKEEDFFTLDYNADIRILKHNRYTPVFKHRHEFFEMIYVYSGNCSQEINGEVINLKESDLCIIPPKVEHTIEVFNDSIILNVLIKSSTFNETFLEVLKYETVLSNFFIKVLYTEDYNNYIIFRTNQDMNLKELLGKLFIEHQENKKYCGNILHNFLMLFFSYLLREYEGQAELPKSLPKSEKLLSILSYMQDHYKTVTLRELSGTFHFSESYLSKVIKSTFGHTFMEIIQTLKLNKAVELLTCSDMKIHTISKAIGFENTTHFIRIFNKVYGVSPNQYRKNIKGKEKENPVK